MEKTIVEYFYENEKKWADRPFLHQPFGDKWETYTWAKVGEMARRLATWLRQKCPKEKAHVSIVSSNCTYRHTANGKSSRLGKHEKRNP